MERNDGINEDTKSIISQLSRGTGCNFTPKAKD